MATPNLRLGEALLDILRLGRCDHRNDAIHKLRVIDCPLKGLVPAVGGSGDGNEMLDSERVEQDFLGRHDIAYRDRWEVGPIACRYAG